MEETNKIKLEISEDSGATPVRVAYVKNHSSIEVERERDKEHMTFPHLIVREVLTFEVIMIILAVVSLLFDAPLEEIATPDHSPNPAKAPWYFLGLQELLHYFPPLVAGVILPGLVAMALIVIPYFRINWGREPIWTGDIRRKFIIMCILFVGVNLPFIIYHSYPIYICSIIIFSLMAAPLVSKRDNGWTAGLRNVPLADWVMIWFIMVASVLTIIGVFFRGPEWRWIWPWIDGIYY